MTASKEKIQEHLVGLYVELRTAALDRDLDVSDRGALARLMDDVRRMADPLHHELAGLREAASAIDTMGQLLTQRGV